MSPPIRPLAGLQRVVFLINSRLKSLTAARLASGETCPEVTSSCFAELLNEGSPVRLSILYQSTCVGFKYGRNIINLRSFSWYPAHHRSPDKSDFQSHLGFVHGGFACHASSMRLPQSNKGQRLLRYVTPSNNIAGPEY